MEKVEISNIQQDNQYNGLIELIGNLLYEGRKHVAHAVNNVLVQTYWQIGKYIVEFEQGGFIKSEYGSKLLDRLSKDLTMMYGKGFSRSNLMYIRKLYIAFPIGETLSHQLCWGHYFQILKADNELEIKFYTKQCEKENWSVRELKRQMNSMLFHRLALSKDKAGVLAIAEKGAYKDRIMVEYAMDNINNHLFVSKYQLFLPEKEQLEKELGKILENHPN